MRGAGESFVFRQTQQLEQRFEAIEGCGLEQAGPAGA